MKQVQFHRLSFENYIYETHPAVKILKKLRSFKI